MEPPRTDAPAPRRGWPLWLLVFAVALGLRLLHLAELRERSPFWTLPFNDSAGYLAFGRQVADGDLLGDRQPFLQGPGYSYFVGLLLALHRLLPDGTVDPLVLLRLAGALVGATSCLLLARITAELAGRTAGLLAGIFGAAYGPLLFFDVEWLPAGLLVCLVLLTLRACQRIEAVELERRPRPPWLAWIGLGLLLGYASLVRMNLLPFTACLVLWGWRLQRWRRRLRPWLLTTLCLAVGCAVPLGLAVWRNWLVSGRVGLVHGGGMNLYLGNNPEWRRTSEARPGPLWHRLYALPGTSPEVDPAAWNRWYLQRARAWIEGNPRAFRDALRIKAVQLASGHERRRNFDLYRFRRYSRVLSALLWHPGNGLAFPFALIGPLALLGLVLRLRRHWRQDLPLLLFLGVYALSILPFFITARYRLPLAVVLLPFAAIALVELARRLPWALLWLVPVFALVPAASRERQPKDPWVEAELRLVLGDAAHDARRLDDAGAHYQAALRDVTDHPTALGRLALLARNAGDLPRALALYDRAIAGDHWSWELFFNRARLHERTGDLRAAASDYREALRLRADVAFLMVHLGRVYLRQGLREQARDLARRALLRKPGDAEARELLDRSKE